MTETRVSSDKREVVLGFDRRFVIIGERIHHNGRKKLAAGGDRAGARQANERLEA